MGGLPGKYPEALKEITGDYVPKDVDVFFVYPTLLTDKKDPSWNADIKREDLRKNVVAQSVKFQASAFAKAGNLYVPFTVNPIIKFMFHPIISKKKIQGCCLSRC